MSLLPNEEHSRRSIGVRRAAQDGPLDNTRDQGALEGNVKPKQARTGKGRMGSLHAMAAKFPGERSCRFDGMGLYQPRLGQRACGSEWSCRFDGMALISTPLGPEGLRLGAECPI